MPTTGAGKTEVQFDEIADKITPCHVIVGGHLTRFNIFAMGWLGDLHSARHKIFHITGK